MNSDDNASQEMADREQQRQCPGCDARNPVLTTEGLHSVRVSIDSFGRLFGWYSTDLDQPLMNQSDLRDTQGDLFVVCQQCTHEDRISAFLV